MSVAAERKVTTTGESFFDTFACRCGDHCCTCRNRIAGHAFRANVADRFALPTTDWPCPYDQPWGFKDQATPIPASIRRVSNYPPETTPIVRTVGNQQDQHPRTIASTDVTTEPGSMKLTETKRRFAICQACERSRDNAFACTLHSGCCFGKHRSKPSAKCPEGKW